LCTPELLANSLFSVGKEDKFSVCPKGLSWEVQAVLRIDPIFITGNRD
jgi:hypothetical protein